MLTVTSKYYNITLNECWCAYAGSILHGVTMSIFGWLSKILADDSKKKPKVHLQYVRRNQNPLEVWEIVNEIGDGAFGKVYKVKLLCCSLEFFYCIACCIL